MDNCIFLAQPTRTVHSRLLNGRKNRYYFVAVIDGHRHVRFSLVADIVPLGGRDGAVEDIKTSTYCYKKGIAQSIKTGRKADELHARLPNTALL